MLQRGEKDWFKSIKAEEVVSFFLNYLSKAPRKHIDSIPLEFKELKDKIYDMPMTKWSGSSNQIAVLTKEEFSFNIEPKEDEASILFDWVNQICLYRLTNYFRKKAFKLENN